MKENTVLLFISFWFSLFFLCTAIIYRSFDFFNQDYFNQFLLILLSILCSFELARKLARKLTEGEK